MKAIELNSGEAIIRDSGLVVIHQYKTTENVNTVALTYEELKEIFVNCRDNYFNDPDLPF